MKFLGKLHYEASGMDQIFFFIEIKETSGTITQSLTLQPNKVEHKKIVMFMYVDTTKQANRCQIYMCRM